MSKMLIIQTIASLGAGVGVVLTYVALGAEQNGLAIAGFAMFSLCMLITPALRLVPRAAQAT